MQYGYLAANTESENNLRDAKFAGVSVVARRFFIYSWTPDDVPRAAVDVVGEVDFLLAFIPTQLHLHASHD